MFSVILRVVLDLSCKIKFTNRLHVLRKLKLFLLNLVMGLELLLVGYNPSNIKKLLETLLQPLTFSMCCNEFFPKSTVS